MARPPRWCSARQRMQIHAGAGRDRGAGGRRRQPNQAGRRRFGAWHPSRPARGDLRPVPKGDRSARRGRPRAGHRRCGRPRDQRPLGGGGFAGRRREYGGHLAPAAGSACGHAGGHARGAAGVRDLLGKTGPGVTDLQGGEPHHAAMDSLTPTQRDRGLERLRRVTFGATAGALVAVVGVSYVAAASYAGTSSANGSATAADTTTSTTATTDSSSSSSSTSSSNSNSLQPSTQAPITGSSGSGTVTSGGS